MDSCRIQTNQYIELRIIPRSDAEWDLAIVYIGRQGRDVVWITSDCIDTRAYKYSTRAMDLVPLPINRLVSCMTITIAGFWDPIV